MRKLLGKLCFAIILVIAFTSCNKNDSPVEENTGTVSFAAVLNQLMSNKQVSEIPDCSDATPAYVDVVVTGPKNIGSIAAPMRIDISSTKEDTNGDSEKEYVTVKDDELYVPAGDYELLYFVVYDSENNPIWIAPSEGNFQDFVEEPLPLSFTVEAATQNYVSVDVVCFENRILNEYGDLFFALDPHQAIEFCMVGNTCDGNDASFSATVYSGADNTGSLLYMDLENTPGEALCMALPDLEGEDQYYFEISMGGSVIREGSITDADVKALFEGDTNINPFIFYEGSSCTNADSPDLFGTGGNTGGGTGGVTEGSFDIPYVESFETATAESVLTDFGYSTENLPGETVLNPGAAGIVQNTFPSVDDETLTSDSWGIQYGYVNNNAETSTGLVDNIVRTSVFNAAAGDYTLTYDVSYIKNLNNHSVEVYFSDDSDGSFENGTWTMIDQVSQADLDAAGVGRQEFQRRTASISTTGNFYLAFRFKADIQADGDGTRWRIDNVKVDAAGSGGATSSSFEDYIGTFEDFDASVTYDPNYLEASGYELYALNAFTSDNNALFEAETNKNYPSLADVTVPDVPDGSGFQLVFNGEQDASNPVYGAIDAVLVSPGQEGADGTYTFKIDARRFFGETAGTATFYYSTSYTPGSGFNEADWNVLGSENVRDLNDSGNFVRREFTGNPATGTIYFAVRIEGDVNDGGTATTGDGNYRFRVRMDNIQIIQE